MRPNSSDNSAEQDPTRPPDHFRGDARKLFPVVYEQLRELAHKHMNREKEGLTLQTTALVHEVYMRLNSEPAVIWENPRHFFAVAAESMRRILIERARRYTTRKRGGGRLRVDFDSIGASVETADPDALLELNEAVTALTQFDARLGEVVMLRYFAGLSVEETAAAMESSPRTVRRDWSVARAWLGRKLSSDS